LPVRLARRLQNAVQELDHSGELPVVRRIGGT
jgi:hypothetical protein